MRVRASLLGPHRNMAELVDALDLGSSTLWYESSILSVPTKYYASVMELVFIADLKSAALGIASSSLAARTNIL